MSSYQEIETRLNVVEDKLEFIMTSMKMRGAQPTGLLDQAGNPSFRVIEGTMLDFYRLAKAGGLQLIQGPPPNEEKNGSNG